MSTPSRPQAPPRARRAPARTPPPMFGGRPMGGLGMPDAEGEELQGHAASGCSATCGRIAPALAVVVVAGAIGTVFSVLGPKILGLATTKIFEGLRREGRGRARAPRSTSTTSAASCSG